MLPTKLIRKLAVNRQYLSEAAAAKVRHTLFQFDSIEEFCIFVSHFTYVQQTITAVDVSQSLDPIPPPTSGQVANVSMSEAVMSCPRLLELTMRIWIRYCDFTHWITVAEMKRRIDEELSTWGFDSARIRGLRNFFLRPTTVTEQLLSRGLVNWIQLMENQIREEVTRPRSQGLAIEPRSD